MAGAKKKQTWIFLLWVLVIIRCALFLSHKIIIPKQQTTTDDDNAWNIWRKTTDDFPCHNPGIKLPLQKNTTDGFPLRDKAFYTPGAFSNPSKIPTHGLLFIKPMKVGSSTATGINLRISKNVAERQHANFSICENSYDHSQGEYFRDRDIPNSFLWSFVRHPTKRAVSWFFHFVVSRKKIKPTISSFKKYTAMQKNYYLKLHKLTDANWKWANKTDQYYQNIIDDILQDYNIALVASIVLIVAFAVEAYDGTMRIFVTVGVCWCTIFSSGVFVLPRLLRVKESTRDRMNGPGGLRTRVSGLSLGTPSGASVVNMSSTVASSRNITHEQVIDEDGEKEEEKEEESAKPEQADATENMTKTDDAAQASASQG